MSGFQSVDYTAAHDRVLKQDWHWSSGRRHMRPQAPTPPPPQQVARERIYREVTGSSDTPDRSPTTLLLLEVLQELRALKERR